MKAQAYSTALYMEWCGRIWSVGWLASRRELWTWQGRVENRRDMNGAAVNGVQLNAFRRNFSFSHNFPFFLFFIFIYIFCAVVVVAVVGAAK